MFFEYDYYWLLFIIFLPSIFFEKDISPNFYLKNILSYVFLSFLSQFLKIIIDIWIILSSLIIEAKIYKKILLYSKKKKNHINLSDSKIIDLKTPSRNVTLLEIRRKSSLSLSQNNLASRPDLIQSKAVLAAKIRRPEKREKRAIRELSPSSPTVLFRRQAQWRKGKISQWNPGRP